MCFFSGEHPRIGVMDVCPFIPVRNVTMEDCVECAREFGERLALELHVPGKTAPQHELINRQSWTVIVPCHLRPLFDEQ